ncbi:MAG TPA: type II secretion system minor pseudopilin GspK [Sphingobium sp.]|nr:type II secretion system minor pseudopilin GspK [Sphingobium sp.]
MAKRVFIRPGEQGAALLTVLLLVAIMSVITAVVLERLTIASRMTQNGVGGDQARAMLLAGEGIAALKLGDVVKARPGRTTLAGDWLNTGQSVAVPGGSIFVRIADAGNCFNVNSLVAGTETYAARPAGVRQFVALMRLLAVPQDVAERIAVSVADWIDSDTVPAGGGAEDSFYQQLPVTYRTAGGLIADPSELRVIHGMTPAVYSRLRPWLCALPVADLSPININTLLPDQGILLAMLTDGKLSPETARQLLARRPADGYGSLVTFWAQPAVSGLDLPSEVTEQTRLTSRWFAVDLRVNQAGADVSETALFDAQNAPARLIRRRWGDDS